MVGEDERWLRLVQDTSAGREADHRSRPAALDSPASPGNIAGMSDPKTIFLAIRVLDEAKHQAAQGRVEPSPGLRLALAVLYDVNNGGEFGREFFDQFWKAATKSDLHGRSAQAFGRSQDLTAAFNAICRAAGMENDHLLEERLRKARAVSP